MSQSESPDPPENQEEDTPGHSATSLPHSSLPPPVVDPGSSHPRRSGSGGRARSSRRGHSHRSRSANGRSRSRHRHSSNRRHSRHRCRTYFQHKERNFASASCSMVTIVLLCTSLEPNWIYMSGGDCHLLHDPKGSLHTLSTRQFFSNGHFYKNYPLTSAGDMVYKFGGSSNDILVNCVTYTAVLLFKASIAFTLIAVVFSFISFLLDLFGPTYQLLKLLRRNAIFNILTVVMCISINLFAYWITSAVERLQESSRMHLGSKVEVTFAASFYLITAAGGMSVLATACNCLRRHKGVEAEHVRQADRYFDDTEALLPPPPPEEDSSPLSNLPPPPPYAP
ncbi:transmembrane protein 127 [Aplysia californica]|uniref:Transmembrane protein 127 n=1 Tax=Aplysia californica TaxID=6500 RepID=A0ABM1VSQ9_APLCA|nr:transmembrane protein 127 [Aplysia californica]XP_035825451.1 transmembrane protein 127 [Aplysia californica]